MNENAAVETTEQAAQAPQGLNLSIEEAGFYIESLTQELAAANEAGRVASVKLHVTNIRASKLAEELKAAQDELAALKAPAPAAAANDAPVATVETAPAAGDAAAA